MSNWYFRLVNRRAATSRIVIVLLIGIFLALAGLIVISLTSGQKGRPSNSKSYGPGERRERDPAEPPKMKPVGDPDRIKEVLQAGKIYRAVVKGGFDARVEDKDWGLKQVTNLAYLVEMQVTRKIETNDGHQIVELRIFDHVRNAKVLFRVEGVSIELGTPGILLLGAIDHLQPGTIAAVAAAKPVVEAFLTGAAQAVADDQATKVFAKVDGLSGKKVRITFVDDGRGVESVTPIDCKLTSDEADFVMDTAVLSDCYLLPDVKVKSGDTWPVDASQFIGFLDPTIRGVPTGQIVVKRGGDEDRNGKQIAKLSIDQGKIELNASDKSTRRIGSFTPRGTLDYNLTDQFIQAAQMRGDMHIEEVSQDHILFEASYRTEPKLQIQYSCEIVP